MKETKTQRRTTPLARSCEAPHSCPRPLRLDVLAHTPYFRGLNRAEIEAIDRRMQVRGYVAGEVVYRVGEPADHLFILATGRVKVLRPSLEGSHVLVDVITPGALFGSVAALGDADYPDTAEALTVACALRMSATDFRALLREHPHVALTVLDDVAARLEQAHQTIRRLSGGTVEQRIAATLLTLADKLGQPLGDSTLLQLPLTRADLAAMTGTTTESVSRTLSALRRAGLIDTGRRWTAVTDRTGLAKLADG
jgi:CRP-like cAMP-binding protein